MFSLKRISPSGCGKSTLLALLERTYDVDAGRVELQGGTALHSINLAWWRRHVAYVQQRPVLFAGTIRDNIAFGRDCSDKEMEAAARDADAHDFICALPDGYATEVQAGGSTALSGGQRQRVALARALLKPCSLLLLDEATSALDNLSQRRVANNLARRCRDSRTTVVLVAHRLSSVRWVDRVVVLTGACPPYQTSVLFNSGMLLLTVDFECVC